MQVRTHIGLGANLGDARRTLRAAVDALASLPGARLAGVSRLYVTRPVGVTDQPDFTNAVVALDLVAGDDPEATAVGLLVDLKRLERALGRRPSRRWGPRAVDLDLLDLGPHRLSIERPPAGRSLDAWKGSPALEVPHPRAQARLFVLEPWADLAPDLEPAGWHGTVAAARDRQRAAEGRGAVRAIARWDPDVRDWRADGDTGPAGSARARDRGGAAP